MTGLDAARGLSAARAVEALSGVTAPSFSGDDADALVAALEELDIAAMRVRLDDVELKRLPTPCAVRRKDGRWLLIRSRGAGDRLSIDTGEAALVSASDSELRDVSGDEAVVVLLSARSPGIVAALLDVYRRSPSSVRQIAGATILLLAAAAAIPFLIRFVIDSAVPNGALSSLTLACVAVLVVAAAQAVVGIGRELWLSYVLISVESTYLGTILRHLFSLSSEQLARSSGGDAPQRFAAIYGARELANDRIIRGVIDIPLALIYLPLIVAASPFAATVVVAVTLISAAVTILCGMYRARLRRLEMAQQGEQAALLTEVLFGIGTIKAARAEARFASKWGTRLRMQMTTSLRTQRVALISETAAEALRAAAAIAVVIALAMRAGGEAMSAGVFVATMQLALIFFSSTTSAAESVAALMLARAQIEPVRRLASLPPRNRIANAAPANAGVAVRARDLWFRHSADGSWVVRRLSFEVRRGEHHRLIGASGSGKTTLIRLIAGFVSPASGELAVARAADTRRLGVAFLPQQVRLFSGTILDNLRIYSGQAPLSDLFETAEETGLGDWVRMLPMGYRTVSRSGPRPSPVDRHSSSH